MEKLEDTIEGLEIDKLNIIDEENEIEDLLAPRIQLSEIRTLSRKLISELKAIILDSGTPESLIENSRQAFSHIIHLANTVTSNATTKYLVQLGAALSRTITDLSKTHDITSEEPTTSGSEDLFHAISANLFQAFSLVEGASKDSALRLKYDSALALMRFVKAIVGKRSFAFSPQQALTMVSITHFLQDNAIKYYKECLVTFSMIKQSQGYDAERFASILINDYTKNSKYTYLALVHDDSHDEALKGLLLQKLGELVFNDQEKCALENVLLFSHFLSSMTEATFKSGVYPQIEFTLKRNGSSTPVVAIALSYLQGLVMNEEVVHMLTEGILTDEMLTKDGLHQECSSIFKVLGQSVKDKPSALLILDFLRKRYIETKASSLTFGERQRLIKHMRTTVDSLKTDLIPQDQVQQLITLLFEHMYLAKEDSILREVLDDILAIVKVHEGSFTFLTELVKSRISKTIFASQVTFYRQLMALNKTGLSEIISIAASQFKPMLAAENFKTIANYPQILALLSFFCQAYSFTQDESQLVWLLQNESIMTYICTKKGYVNTISYFNKGPSLQDAKAHLKILEVLLTYFYAGQQLPQSDFQLRDTLFEYLLNQSYVFRQHEVLDCFERVFSSELSDKLSSSMLMSLYNKIKQVSQRPVIVSRDEAPHKQTYSPVQQVRSALKLMLKHKTTEFTKEEFFYILKSICHPYVSRTQQDLTLMVSELERYLKGKDKPLKHYFHLYQAEILDYCIIQRTGILAPDETLRQLASNMAVAFAQQGYYASFLNQLQAILNQKPFELCEKLEKVFTQEFDRINHYELLFFSEISKDLLVVFSKTDEENRERELSITSESEGPEGGAQEEEKKEALPTKTIDPSKLAAQMLKQAAAQKKASEASKKGSKVNAQAKPKAVAQKPRPEKDAVTTSEAAPIDKEQRNKQDRAQILSYIQEIQQIKGQHIETALGIVRRVNSCKVSEEFNYLDDTLAILLQPMISLLHHSHARFSVLSCFNELFTNQAQSIFFKIKKEIVASLIVISSGRIQQKNQKYLQVIFSYLDETAHFEDLDKGYLRLILLMVNFALKDLSVNLSVKELALQVTQSILDNNVKVQTIDLVRVTINMMKSSYVNDNLSTYLHKLMRKISKEELALMLQRLFEYEPIPKQKFLKELIEFDEPLFCPVWFASQIWILQFDDECGKLAKRLWNKYGLVLRSGVIDLQRENEFKNIFYYLRSPNTNIFDASVKSAITAIELFQNRYDLIIDDLIEFYDKEMSIIERDGLDASEAAQQSVLIPNYRNQADNDAASKNVMADSRLNRIAVPEILKRTAHLVQASSFKKIFDFFIVKGCLDQNEQVAKACMDAALMIIKQRGSDYSEEMLRILERYINEQKKYSENSKNQAIIMIGSLATYLDNTSQKKLVATFEKMLELLNTPSELIRQSICKVIPQLARFFEDKSKKFLEDHLRILRESTDEKLLRGSAYAVSGILKGLGMQVTQQMQVLQILQKECFSKQADPLRKISGLYLYETMALSLGKMFEMNIDKILPNIMQCISDSKEQVRRAAIQANKTLMSRFSNYTIKQVLPIFLKGLYDDNWRSKLASVEALGTMAFCAPKQISGFLPEIVKGVREVLNDTHEKVHAAALQAIQNIGSVIRCPEIADILETLVKALSNPNVHLKNALKVLLDTSFVHAIDAPSLSLLVPILDSGLMMHDNQSKQLAAKLMGNICNLTQDPEDLLPYIKILMPAIKNSLFDSIPEIRSSAAKAMGSLSKGLGIENSSEIILWLQEVLHSKSLASSERSGASQGFAEIVSMHGVRYFEENIPIVVLKCKDDEPQVRESYRSVLLFLATSFDQFVKYLPSLLPIMIEGLSDDVEEVRKISLRNVKICIKQFGRQAPGQLVEPIKKMMFDKDFRVRSSSSILMYQLVKELENDIIKSQPKYLTNETKNEILSAMFILKYDTIEKVAIQASQIWKNIIDNQLKILKQVITVCIEMVFSIIQSEYLELQEMGLNCMRGIVEKFGEKIVSECLDIMEIVMERATQVAECVGVSKAIYNMVHAAPNKLLSELRSRFLSIVDPNLSHEMEEIRKYTAQTFVIVFGKTFEPNYMVQTLDRSIMKKMHYLIVNQEIEKSKLLVLSLKLMMKEGSDLKLEDKLINLCNVQTHDSPFTIAQAKVLCALAPNVAHQIFKKKFYGGLLNALLNELTVDNVDDEPRAQEVLIAFSELISCASSDEIATVNELISDFYSRCQSKGRLSFYVDFIAYYCRNSKTNYEKYAREYLRNVLLLMNNESDKLVDKVIEGFNAIMEGLTKENQFAQIPLIKSVIEQLALDSENLSRGLYSKKVPTLRMFEKDLGIKYMTPIIQSSITHGSIEIRIDSAICFQYLIDFSKPEAIKKSIIPICGALIRVVNDKFQPQLKIPIFQAFKLILLKADQAVKAMVPQLQTTFLKAFNDTMATPLLRKVVVECILLFIRIAPKIDPIVKDIVTNMIEGDKVDNDSKVEASEALALIIKLHGKSLQPAMVTLVQTALINILESKKSLYNDKTIVNCATALAFLTGQAETGEELFSKYDSTLDARVTLGIKCGVLMSGPSQPSRAALMEQLEAHTQTLLKAQSGIQEIDNFDSDDCKPELLGGRLSGAFEILGYIGDTFIRRFGRPQECPDLYSFQYRAINQAKVYEALNSLELPHQQTSQKVLTYLQAIPVQLLPSGSLDPQLQTVIREGVKYINNYYLEFESKMLAKPAVLNLLMLNFNNYLDVNDEAKIFSITYERAKTVVNGPLYKELMEENIRILAVELSQL